MESLSADKRQFLEYKERLLEIRSDPVFRRSLVDGHRPDDSELLPDKSDAMSDVTSVKTMTTTNTGSQYTM